MLPDYLQSNYHRLTRKIFCSIILLLNIIFSQRVVGYYPQWVIGSLPANEIDLNVVTHIIHSFAWPNENGSISSYNGMFGSGISDVIHNQGAKFLLSLGGWGNHAGFEVISGDEDLRELFINNLVNILLVNGYDGVDLDWEFPDSEMDRENLNLLVSDMDSMFAAINSDWMITMAVPVSNWFGQWHDFEFLVNHIDFFNAMTYGTHGNWSSHSGHLAPLYSSPPGDPDGSCHASMNYLSNTRSIPKNKLNMGMPFWGVKWESSNINEPFTGSTADIMYYEIPELIGNGWTYYWDEDALCPYLIKDDGTRVITYENQQSIGLKCQYAAEQELGGVMIWALSYDETNNGQELIQSIQENYLSSYSEEPYLIPMNISLKTYPNPLNPSCKIDIKIAQGQLVKIMVNDLLGHQIKLLNNKVLQKGHHQFLWNAKNYPNGTYFITVKYNQSIDTKKVTLLK